VSKGIDRREVVVPAVLEPTYAAAPRSHGKPILDSYDSGDECSFYHWLEVCKLVDDADLPSVDEGLPYAREIEEALEETMSEVEPATAYQYFAGNVV
jgi:hypothetical protein